MTLNQAILRLMANLYADYIFLCVHEHQTLDALIVSCELHLSKCE